MSKSKQPKLPKYCLHKPSGRGYVTIEGKQHYFPGKHGSPESLQAYDEFIGNYLANGRKLPSTEPPPKPPNIPGTMTCRELAIQFLEWSVSRYDAKGHSHCWAAMYFLTKYFGNVPVDDFIPVSLEHLQKRMAVETADPPPGKDGKERKKRKEKGGYARIRTTNCTV